MDFSSVSANTTHHILYPRAASLLAFTSAIVFIIVGVLGNFVTILALTTCSKLRGHATTMFVLSLCLSDLLFCSLSLPLTASRYLHQEWRLGNALCQLFPVIFYGNVAVSLLSMVAITLNRYILIAYYEFYSSFYTMKSIWFQLVSIWVLSFSLMLPPLMGVWGRLGLDPATFSCTILKKDGHSPKKFLFLVGFAIPCVVIILSYSCIFWKVQKSKKKLKAHSQKNPKETGRCSREDDNRLTSLMLSIFVCFVLCFLPLMIMNVADDDNRYPWLHIVASILAWASSVINPVIYAATNRQYRTAYGNLFKRFARESSQSNAPASRSLYQRTTDNIS